jgi:hypothetical protein
MLSALVVLLFAVLGWAGGAPHHAKALGVAGALALVWLVTFRRDYRNGQ